MTNPNCIKLAAPPLARYATAFDQTRGRAWPEMQSDFRTPFMRDRDRVIHSTAFRRLKHKTQVFVSVQLDHYRTRLTHSLEVAQIARTVARALHLNEDLAETLALAHDLGHPPFGHAGEEALSEALATHGGAFDHNEHTIRIVWQLENRYAQFAGLNLTAETLEGLAKHNGPVNHPTPLLTEISQHVDLHLATYGSLEAQVAALADDIAYICHDIDDGVRSKLISLESLPDLPLLQDAMDWSNSHFAAQSPHQRQHEVTRRLMHMLVENLIYHSMQNINAAQPDSPLAAQQHDKPLIDFDETGWFAVHSIKSYLYNALYKHPQVKAATESRAALVSRYTHHLLTKPDSLPNSWQFKLSHQSVVHVVRDYIAGMTDRYLENEAARLNLTKIA